ncbi:MAG: DUF1638 domain-containing protein [Rhodospirillales bacterium]
MPGDRPTSEKTLMIACGALANETLLLIERNGWDFMDVTCLPANFHNYPDRIPAAMRAKIRDAREKGYGNVVALFADCGTGGTLDAVLEEEGVDRIPGAHCYEFYSGSAAFNALAEEEIGTFYLTDFLARHFDRLIIEGLGIDRHPELKDMYFNHYKRLVYLAQVEDADLDSRAEAAAEKLGLEYRRVFTGLDPYQQFMARYAPPAAS